MSRAVYVIAISMLMAAGVLGQTPIDWSQGVAYEYDGSGNVKKIGTDAYVYDTAQRLVRGSVRGSQQSYTYDAFGNRTGCDQGGGDCQYGWDIDSATNRVAGRTYDARGNMLQLPEGDLLHYDDLGMPRMEETSTGRVYYIYTADDERIAVYESAGAVNTWRWTIRGLDKKPLREFTSDNTGNIGIGNFEWSKDYVWRDGSLLASRQADANETGGVSTYHYHVDHLGTPRQITDAAGTIIGRHDYLAFGPELTSSLTEPVTQNVKFTGHERDSVGARPPLDYMHARYYEGRLGRFLSVDPNAFWELQRGSDEDRAKFRSYLRRPQRWNRYAYVSNNPINKIDPDGREENFYMEQLFHEQQMVGEGKMTEEQYWERRRAEGYGALAGTAAVGGWFLGARIVTMGYTAFQAWRAASAAAATIKAIQQVSGTDARIFQNAMNMARGGANTFMNNLTALSRALEQIVPGGKINAIGKIGDQVVYGSARTRIGITVIDGVTKVVRQVGDKWEVLGNFR